MKKEIKNIDSKILMALLILTIITFSIIIYYIKPVYEYNYTVPKNLSGLYCVIEGSSDKLVATVCDNDGFVKYIEIYYFTNGKVSSEERKEYYINRISAIHSIYMHKNDSTVSSFKVSSNAIISIKNDKNGLTKDDIVKYYEERQGYLNMGISESFT